MDNMNEQCCLQEIAFKWMFHAGILKNLHEQCQQYESECSSHKMDEKRIYRFILTADVGELLDFNAQLGNVVCNQSEKAKEIFQEACFICIRTLNWIPKIMSKTQVDLHMRYRAIPRFISCSSLFTLKRELLESGPQSMPLFCTVGVVMGMTSRVNYTRSTWYKCTNKSCHSSMESGCAVYSTSWGSENLSREMICIGCGIPLEEDISCRILGEKCFFHIASPDGLKSRSSTNENCKLYRSISVYVRDELITDVVLGSCYSFSLIPHREFYTGQNSTSLNLVFEANNATKINAFPVSSVVPRTLTIINSKFCQIQRLREDCKSSSWSFAASLAYFFADSITPAGTYVRLKLGVLLSLVSQQSLNEEEQISKGQMHILAVSKDVLPIQRLFLYSKSFAERSLVFSPCNDLCYSISKGQSNLGSCIIHGGCVLLASDGVLVLSNLNELKNDQVEELENVVQSECVNIDIPKKYIGCQQSQISVPVTCKIWACSETTKKQGTKSLSNTYQNLQENGQLSKTLVDYFSLVFVMAENEASMSETFAESVVVKNIMARASAVKEQETYRISENEFLEFLPYAAAIKPLFSNEARELIQGFYLASRRSRSSSGVTGVEFPIAALKSMMSLAEAHAKLSLRSKVSEDDAVMAILLYEESITARVGYSVLGVTPVQHFQDENTNTYIGEKNDEKMTQLKIHMKRFCSLHSNYKYTPGSFPREE